MEAAARSAPATASGAVMHGTTGSLLLSSACRGLPAQRPCSHGRLRRRRRKRILRVPEVAGFLEQAEASPCPMLADLQSSCQASEGAILATSRHRMTCTHRRLQGDTLLLSFLQCTLEVLVAVIVLPGVYAVAHRDGQVTPAAGGGVLGKHDHWLPWHDMCSLCMAFIHHCQTEEEEEELNHFR